MAVLFSWTDPKSCGLERLSEKLKENLELVLRNWSRIVNSNAYSLCLQLVTDFYSSCEGWNSFGYQRVALLQQRFLSLLLIIHVESENAKWTSTPFFISNYYNIICSREIIVTYLKEQLHKNKMVYIFETKPAMAKPN